MSAQTVNAPFKFELPSLSYIDAKWEEPSLRIPAASGRPARPASLFARLGVAFQKWRQDNQAATELATMSDRELLDIGISRSDLARVFEPEFNQDLRQRDNLA